MRAKLLASTLAVLFVIPAQAAVIDNFSVGADSVTGLNLGGQSKTQTGLDSASVIGGTRRLFAGSSTGSTIGATLAIEPSLGHASFSSDPAQAAYFDLEYGTVTPLGVDLTADGADHFAIAFDHVNLTAPFTLDLTVISNVGGDPESTDTFNLVNRVLALPGGTGIVEVPFSMLTGTNFGEVNGIGINAARLTAGGYFEINSITTVPEPSAIALLGIGVIGLVRWGRRAGG